MLGWYSVVQSRPPNDIKVRKKVNDKETTLLHTHSCNTSAHSSGNLQWTRTDRDCFGGSYAARFFATIASIKLDKWTGKIFPVSQELGFKKSTTRTRAHDLSVRSAEFHPKDFQRSLHPQSEVETTSYGEHTKELGGSIVPWQWISWWGSVAHYAEIRMITCCSQI